MRRFLLALSAVALLASPVIAAPGDRALEDVRILSADDMEGRLVGSPGGAKARAYILGRMREIGLDPVQQTFVIKRKDGTAERPTETVVKQVRQHFPDAELDDSTPF